MVLVWNVVSPIVSTRRWEVAREGEPVDEGVEDVGGSERRTVIARIGVLDFALLRKEADFRLVLDHEKRAEQLNRRGYLDDDCRKASLKARCARHSQLEYKPVS